MPLCLGWGVGENNFEDLRVEIEFGGTSFLHYRRGGVGLYNQRNGNRNEKGLVQRTHTNTRSLGKGEGEEERAKKPSTIRVEQNMQRGIRSQIPNHSTKIPTRPYIYIFWAGVFIRLSTRPRAQVTVYDISNTEKAEWEKKGCGGLVCELSDYRCDEEGRKEEKVAGVKTPVWFLSFALLWSIGIMNPQVFGVGGGVS